jgi:hypothetical protein
MKILLWHTLYENSRSATAVEVQSCMLLGHFLYK